MIKHYSNLNDLKEIWLGQDEKKVSNFDEDISLLFDSFCFDDFIKECEQENVTPALINELINFRNALESYKKPSLELEILEDPNWINIVAKAKHIVDIWQREKLPNY